MMFKLIGRLLRDSRGAVAVELAMAVPIVAALTLSGVEIARFVMLNQKIERASVTVADLTSQAESLSEADLSDLFQISSQVLAPFETDGRIQVIVSSAGAISGNPARVNWQRSFGTSANSSTLGGQGAAATLPTGFTIRDNENVIVAEVYYGYVPLIVTGIIDPVTLYNVAYFRPRFSTLDTLE